MYSPEVIALFAAVKHLFDPGNLLNPGVLVDPRAASTPTSGSPPGCASRGARCGWPTTAARSSTAVHRCTGVGKCVADNTGAGGVMCPSYLATRDEKDSTRGRARVLQEMVNGSLVTDGWRSDEVHEALDLCLSCKGCATDCPTGIDMATYKAEALHQRYRRPAPAAQPLRAGPAAALGPARPARRAARQRVLRVGPVQRLAKAAAGIDQRRSRAGVRAPSRCGAGPAAPTCGVARPTHDVVVWADSFTDGFASDTGRAAVAVLEAAGLRVGRGHRAGLLRADLGQHRPARPRPAGSWAHTLDVLHPYVAAGIPVVGLEPSCLATLRSDAVELTADPRAAEVAAGVRSLAEVLSRRCPGWDAARPDRYDGRGAAALPPRQRGRLGRRRRPARPHRRRR